MPTIEFDIRTKNFSFYHELFQKGSYKLPPNSLTNFKSQFYIDILSFNLINNIERKIEFHFRLETNPNIGIVDFDGEFILETTEQNKIGFSIQNIPQAIRKVIDNFILKNSMPYALSLIEQYRKK